MGDLDVLTPDLANEFDIVIAGHTHRGSGVDRFYDQAHDLGGFGTAIHEVAEEHELASVRVTPRAARLFGVTQHVEQRGQFVVTSMDIADDVEGAVLMLSVIPERLAFNKRPIHLLR